MMQRWSADTIRFMCDASAYGSYHEKLVQALLPFLPQQGHICDAGCGLGHLSLALAPYCAQVTAVDTSEAALSVLRQQKLPANLSIRQGDIAQMQASYDGMIFCYFGRTEQILQVAATQCRGTVIVVRRDCGEHRFSLASVPRKAHSVDSLCRSLKERGIDYHSEGLSLELGQPFRSLEDALCFFSLYNKSDRPVCLEELSSRLEQTGDPTFPWYYPNRRDMELIVFRGGDVKL